MNLLETVCAGVVDLSWRCSWVILLVLALRPWLAGRIPARVVFWIWIALSLRLLLPVSVPSAWSPFTFSPDSRPSAPAAFAAAPALDLGSADLVNLSTVLPPSRSSTAVAGAGVLAGRSVSPGPGLAALWAAGAAALLFARLTAQARFHRALRRSRSSPPLLIQRLVAEAATEAGLRPLPVWVTRAVSAPALHGILRPQLLFPAGFVEKLTPDELRFIVAHELAHARRRDLLAHAVLHAALVVHWFNPLAWIAVRLAGRDCELACDETVLDERSEPERVSYGAALLRTISLVSCRVPPPAALGVVESKQELKRRLAMIMGRPSSARLVTLAGCALVTAGLVVSVTREARAETTSASSPPAPQPAAVRSAPPITETDEHDPAFARLNALFPNGVVAVVGDRPVTVAELRRELLPLISQVRSGARDEREFAKKLEVLQNEVTASLVKRILLIKEFRQHMDPEKEAAIAPEAVERQIEQEVLRRYDGDRSKLLADLATRGSTLSEFRQEIEEELIYWYMRRQERTLFPKQSRTATAPDVAAARAVQAADEAAGVRRTRRQTLPGEPAARLSEPAETSERPVRQPRT